MENDGMLTVIKIFFVVALTGTLTLWIVVWIMLLMKFLV